MSSPIIETNSWHAENYDLVIDVRSPGEFAEDHIVGAVNMPVLFDEQRAEIGTIYKQISPFQARKTGAVWVARNISDHIESHFQDKNPDFKPLIYCWRGGQRSRAFARICSEIGWRCHLLEGGYKAYRRDLLAGLETYPAAINFIIIAGRTGTGKTDLLKELHSRGAQIIDLEELASHKGSLLGQIPGVTQPRQRHFESLLHDKLRRIDPTKPVFIESESSRIGNVQIPALLWQKMTNARLITINSPLEARADYLLSVYQWLREDNDDLKKLISGMSKRHGLEKTGAWSILMRSGKWQELACALLSQHYDPAYDSAITRHQREIISVIDQSDCSSEQLQKTATAILTMSDMKIG